MKFNLLSDLHLEMSRRLKDYRKFVFPKTAPYLLLAGDIGRIQDFNEMKKFLHNASESYQHVFFILGNHEGYKNQEDRCSYWNAAVSGARSLSHQFENVHFLHHEAYELVDDDGSKIVILGTPLHSHIPEDAADIVTKHINDFCQITDWTVKTHNEEHEKAKLFLREATKKYSKEHNCKLIGLFHYPPLNRNVCAPEFEVEDKKTPLSTAFCTDLSSEPWFDRLQIIIFGHTHWNEEQTKNGVQLISNQRGYKEEMTRAFVKDKVFQF